MKETTPYVVGFVVTEDRKVLLIKKKRPKWQEGKLNGIGSRVHDGEFPAYAMTRETFEETGVFLTAGCWTHLLTRTYVSAEGPDSLLHVYAAYVTSAQIAVAESRTDEEVVTVDIAEVLNPDNNDRFVQDVPEFVSRCVAVHDHSQGHL